MQMQDLKDYIPEAKSRTLIKIHNNNNDNIIIYNNINA